MVENGRLTVGREGSKKKFVKEVDHITFSGKYARKIGQPVIYVTERAVFSLEKDGLTLIEVAPGLDVEKDVIAAMEFRPKISPELKEMPRELFAPHWGKLKEMFEGNGYEEEAVPCIQSA
jgi:propionate CoA-transferase